MLHETNKISLSEFQVIAEHMPTSFAPSSQWVFDWMRCEGTTGGSGCLGISGISRAEHRDITRVPHLVHTPSGVKVQGGCKSGIPGEGV